MKNNETEFANQDEEISVDWRMTAIKMANKAKEIENFHFERWQKLIKEQGEDAETPEKDAVSNRWGGAKQVADEMCEMATHPLSNPKAKETSYKDMWKRLKGGIWSQMKANENNAVDGSYHDALEDVLAFICEMEEEIKK